jgi:transcriptional regulator GlxA family with amidase domain
MNTRLHPIETHGPTAPTITKKITVAMLVFPGFQLLDIAGPKDAFAAVKELSQGACEYDMLTVGTTRSSVLSSSGLEIVPDRTIFDPCPHFDTVIVPGGPGVFDGSSDVTLNHWLSLRNTAGRRMAAISSGVFALGAAGLIDGKHVTTHWLDIARLASAFPAATIEPDNIYAKDGQIYTAAGATASIDLSLVMIEEDFGSEMALNVAKHLLVHLRRAAGQSQFSPLLVSMAGNRSPVLALQQYMLANLRDKHRLASLAAHAHMSERSLSRIFADECGISPMQFLAQARLDLARRYLENTHLPLKDIARRCGFDGAESLRRAFKRRLDIIPVDYRHRFQSASHSSTPTAACETDHCDGNRLPDFAGTVTQDPVTSDEY